MLSKTVNTAWVLAFLLFISGFGFCVWDAEHSRRATHYQANYEYHYEHHEGHDGKSFWERTTEDPVTLYTLWLAIFTAVLSLSTIGLWVVTWRGSIRQSQDMKATIELARDEFNATYRPEIIAYSFEPSSEGISAEKIAVQVSYLNRGRAAGKIVEISATITLRQLPLQTEIRLNSIPVPKGAINISKRGRFLIDSNILDVPQIVHERKGIHPSDPRVFCIGRIVYEDGSGRRRETGFCRLYNGVTRHWEAVENSEYEYSY